MNNLIGMLRAGDHVKVAFGSKGMQLAVVHSITNAGNVRVQKYRVKSNSWTKPVRLYPHDLLAIVKVAERAD